MRRLQTIFEDYTSDNSEGFKKICRLIQSSKSNPSYKPEFTFTEIIKFLLDKDCKSKHLVVMQPLGAGQQATGEEKLYGDYSYIQAVPYQLTDEVIIRYTHVLHVDQMGVCTLHERGFAEKGDFSKPMAELETIGGFKCPVSYKKTQNKLKI